MSTRFEWIYAPDLAVDYIDPTELADLSHDGNGDGYYGLALTTPDGDGVIVYGDPSDIASQLGRAFAIISDAEPMSKPRIFRGPASAHESHNERIREFSDSDGNGGLLSIRKLDGRLIVEVYCTTGVEVRVDPKIVASDIPDPSPKITTWVASGPDSLNDGATVVQIDTDPNAGRLRVNVNDAPVWDGYPDGDEAAARAEEV